MDFRLARRADLRVLSIWRAELRTNSGPLSGLMSQGENSKSRCLGDGRVATPRQRSDGRQGVGRFMVTKLGLLR